MEKIIQTAGKMQLGDFAPEFAHYNDDVLFGENWNNQDIDLKTRCIVTMVALMSSGITDSSLLYHLENAKAHGVTKAEAAAIITHAAFMQDGRRVGQCLVWQRMCGKMKLRVEMQKLFMLPRWYFLSASLMTALHSILPDEVSLLRFPHHR